MNSALTVPEPVDSGDHPSSRAILLFVSIQYPDSLYPQGLSKMSLPLISILLKVQILSHANYPLSQIISYLILIPHYFPLLCFLSFCQYILVFSFVILPTPILLKYIIYQSILHHLHNNCFFYFIPHTNILISHSINSSLHILSRRNPHPLHVLPTSLYQCKAVS